MSWPSSIFVGILTAIVSLIASTYVANLAVTWYRVSSFEAQSAAFVASFAVLGFIVGFVTGVITSRVISDPGFLKALGSANGIQLALIAIIGGTARLLADVPPTIDGEELMLAVEIRWPASHTTSPAMLPGEPSLILGSVTRMSHTQRASSSGPLWTSDAKLVDGRWVAPGAVDIFTTRGRLSLAAMLDSTTNPGFMLPLSGRPRKNDLQWTEWYPHARPGAPPLPDGFQYRYRVQKRSEPVRTETFGPFEVQTIASYFFNDTYEGKTVLATMGRFAIKHRGKLVTVDGKPSDSTEASEHLDRANGVAVIGGPQLALLAHFSGKNDENACYVLTDESERLRTMYVPDCATVNGAILTSDTAGFRNAERTVPRGRVNRVTFATPALYTVGESVLDSRRLAVHPYKFPEGFATFPSTPPLGISPDERSFVRIGSSYNENQTSIAVVDFVGQRSYMLPVDEARMRYATPDVIDPAWLMHHFTWQKGTDGIDSLVERRGFVPMPYHFRFTGTSGYWLEPAREPLRDAVIEFIVSEFKGERIPVESYAYEYPVKIGGDTINVAYGSSGHYVSVSLSRDGKDTKLLESIVHRFDAALATGKYDAMFGK